MRFTFSDAVQPIQTDDFWYDLFDGGYIKPEKLLEYNGQVKEIQEAIKTLKRFKSELEEKNLVKEI